MPFLPGDDLPWPDDAIEVGRILGAWGIKGGFRVQPFAADPQALFSSRRWFLKAAESAGPVGRPASALAAKAAGSASLPPVLKITLARDQGDSLVANAQEVPDRDTAELLKGARVFVSRASFPAPEVGEFYWIDLIGLAVANREGLALGTVVGLIETGPHCVLRIARGPGAVEAGAAATAQGASEPAADEILIPFVQAYVDQVDLPRRCIVVDWGLDY